MKTLAWAAVAGIVLLAGMARPARSDDRLNAIVGAAAAREAAFDRVDARYSIQTSLGGVGRAVSGMGAMAGAQQQRGGQVGGGEQRGGGVNIPGLPGMLDSMPLEISGQWLKSSDNQFGQTSIKSAAQPNLAFNITNATDGQVGRSLVDTPRGARGLVAQAGSDPNRIANLTPEHFVTDLPFTVGSMRDLLEAKPAQISFNNGRRGQTTIEAQRETRIVGTEVIDGRECVVVEVVENWGGRRGAGTAQRMYFAEDLNYACVAFETGGRRGDGFDAAMRWTMSDFREVAPGLFVPHSALCETGSGNRKRTIATFTVDSLSLLSRLDLADMSFEFPVGTRVFDALAGVNYTVGEVPGSLDALTAQLASIEEVDEAAAAAALAAVPTVAQTTAQMSPRSKRMLVALLAALAPLVLVTAFYLLRRRRV